MSSEGSCPGGCESIHSHFPFKNLLLSNACMGYTTQTVIIKSILSRSNEFMSKRHHGSHEGFSISQGWLIDLI